MPALEMAQETGKLVRWIKHEGEAVNKGEPIMEIETDKVTVEIESPATGTLGQVTAKEGDVVIVGKTIAFVFGAGETAPTPTVVPANAPIAASPIARKMAEEHGLDLALVKPNGGRVEKADVVAYINKNAARPQTAQTSIPVSAPAPLSNYRLIPASPRARVLAVERGLDLAGIAGTGPGGAVISADVASAAVPTQAPALPAAPAASETSSEVQPLSTAWRVMVERMSTSWTSVPHFYLVRDVSAVGLAELRTRLLPTVQQRVNVKLTYTDLLVKLVAAALRDHPNLNAAWAGNGIRFNNDVNIGIATAASETLIVPVIHKADAASLSEIAKARQDLVSRAADNKLRPADLVNGTFTISNLGMYNVDAFNAIVNPPQAAILAVGRIADRVVPENGQVVIRPMMTLTLSCDHRVADGARAAKFLDDLATLIENPWRLLA